MTLTTPQKLPLTVQWAMKLQSTTSFGASPAHVATFFSISALDDGFGAGVALYGAQWIQFINIGCYDAQWHTYRVLMTAVGYKLFCDNVLFYNTSVAPYKTEVSWIRFGMHYDIPRATLYCRMSGYFCNASVLIS